MVNMDLECRPICILPHLSRSFQLGRLHFLETDS